MYSILAILVPCAPFLVALWLTRSEVTVEAARAEVDQ